jgi:uncharacterized iron-regulated membrane protein
VTSAFLTRPHTVVWRKALFQVHLWTGLVIGVYLFAVGISGSILVFRSELQRLAYPHLFKAVTAGAPVVSMTTLVENVRAAFPKGALVGIDAPTTSRDTFLSYVFENGQYVASFSDPSTGRVLGTLPERSVFAWIQEVHFNLLAGSIGHTLNGAVALGLGVMALTGIVVWWQGTGSWRRGFRVEFGRSWKRVTWDVHSAAGVWLFVLLVGWSLSAVSFVFYQPFRRAVAHVSPVTPAPDVQSVPHAAAAAVEPEVLVARARAWMPSSELVRVSVPTTASAPFVVVMTEPAHTRESSRLSVSFYFDQFSGELLAKWDDAPRTAGDFVMSWMAPIHLGTFGGRGVKVVWAIFGLAPPLLFATGGLMWWNRVVRARWLA